jgi:hypothetical protein
VVQEILARQTTAQRDRYFVTQIALDEILSALNTSP